MRSIQDILESQTELSAIVPVPKKNIKKKKIIAPRNEVVFQHNNLIEANYRLSLQEKRIILWLVSQIQPTDEDFKKHKIKAIDLCSLIDSELNYQYLHHAIKTLMEKTIHIRKLHEDSLTTLHWVDYAKCWFKEGVIELSFHPEMKPFLLQLKERFTALKLSDLMQFNSIYAVRIYELLKQYESLHERTIKVLDIRGYCGITDDKLDQYSEFKTRVLKIAQREINNKSDIKFGFEELKTGRKITDIKFIIRKNPSYKSPNNPQKLIASSPKLDTAKELEGRIIRGMNRLGIPRASMTKFLTQYNTSMHILANALAAIEIQIQKGQVQDPKAMFKVAVGEKWHPDYFLPHNKK